MKNKEHVEISDKVVEVKNIKNPRLKQIIESYRSKDGFIFFGLFSGGHTDENVKHSDRWSDPRGSSISVDDHSDHGGHTDYYSDGTPYSDYEDHTDHTDAPRHSEYRESAYHTDSNRK